MQTLEDRTEKSRREMDLHDTIDTVRVLNARNRNVDIDKVCCARAHCVYLANVLASASCNRSILTAFKIIAVRRSRDSLAELECSRLLSDREFFCAFCFQDFIF